MADLPRRIALLPEEVRARLSSSIDITSHEQVVVGLLENALDASARSIKIHLDLARGYFSVQDDGIGIPQTEFMETGYLGQPHCTSKLESSGNPFGRYGRFLHCLSVVSLLSITSRHNLDTSASRLILRRGSVIHRKLQLDEPGFDSHQSGTRIEVHNLFGDIPVRSRYMYEKFASSMEIERAFEVLRGTLTGYLLACSGLMDLSCTMNGTSRRIVHRRPFDMDSARQLTPGMVISILSQTIPGVALNTTNWRTASVNTSKHSISAVISAEPAPSPLNQHISIGRTPVHAREDYGMLFRTINNRFRRSRFGQIPSLCASTAVTVMPGEPSQDSVHSQSQKRVDRWPMFYIRVNDPADGEASQGSHQKAPLTIRDTNTSITRALESMISHFLVAEGLESGPKKAHLAHRDKSRQRQEVRKATSTSAYGSLKTTSQLNQWHRIKSGRSNLKDTDYGLPFAKSAAAQDTQVERNQEIQLLLEESSSDQPDRDARLCEDTCIAPNKESNDLAHSSLDDTQIGGMNESVIWINPCNERPIHINSRTGSTVENDETVSTTRLRTRIASLHGPGGSNITGPTLDYSPNLESYGKIRLNQHETSIISIPSSELIDREETAPVYPVKWSNHVTKEGLSRANILGQVDQKFILVTIKDLIILIDQHAADERVKLEQLCRDLCIGDATILAKPLIFEIEENEASLFQSWQAYFKKWQIIYTVEQSTMNGLGHREDTRRQGLCISVTALPNLVAERCRAEPALLIELIRKELWSDRSQSKLETCSRPSLPQSWHAIASSCPHGILELLKSRSCRTAIMFNDILDIEECQGLVRQLSKCDLPFQCAHGRPTLTVLTKMGLLDKDPGSGALGTEAPMYDSRDGFGAAWVQWSSSF
ncbi:hypothetical protein LTR84_003377 [Exophiala bonariae]|uniref:MutL C-terminal dimerisation domain-containing protein n=1 Tax=Exophiala bonariae TaxID=1690606 RepID=A0AAV9N7X5_9EURO|nr:hypothetical protein LTR84_003377 [Exophiala bonariae]